MNALGPVLVRLDDRDYQGDTFVLYRFGRNDFGFLNFGWGSCSGCDALQACSKLSEVQAIIDGFVKNLFRGTAKEVAEHIRTRVEANTYFSSSSEWPKFVEQAAKALKIEIPVPKREW